MKPLVVTGWTDLGFRPTNDQPACLPKEKYELLRDGLVEAVGVGRIHNFWEFPYKDLWVPKEFDLKTLRPDTPTPQDRFADSWQHLKCNAWQHERTTFAVRAVRGHPGHDVMIWLDIGILKQGFWKNNPVTKESITRFVERIAGLHKMDTIPFPGITAKGAVYQGCNNWRFCGSTHIWPVKFLPEIDRVYKGELRKWVEKYKTLPLDLPIWALTEKESGLPFVQYPGEYDASQLDGFQP